MLLTLSLALQLRAQGHADGRAPRLVTAVRVARGPAINGRLDESVWRVAPPARGFIQQLPNDGRDPSESTTVRILYDDQAMYIGARLWDDRPALIARQLSRAFRVTDFGLMSTATTIIERRSSSE
jgi:hypothetical protein